MGRIFVGAHSRAWPSLADAIDAGAIRMGDEVVFSPGGHRMDMTIRGARFTALEPGTARLVGPLRITGRSFIDNLDLHGPLWVDGPTELVVDRCNLTNPAGALLILEDTARAWLTHCTLSRNGPEHVAISASSSSHVVLKDTTVEAFGDTSAVHLATSSRMSAEASDFRGNVWITGGAHAQMEGCGLFGETNAIGVTGRSSAFLRDCHLSSGNQRYPTVWLEDHAELYLNAIRINNSAGIAINTNESSTLTIEGAVVGHSKSVGVRLGGGSHAKLQDLSIVGGESDALQVLGRSDVSLISSSIDACAGGIFATSNSTVAISDTTVSNVRGGGILVTEGARLSATQLRVTRGRLGLKAMGSGADLRLADSVVADCMTPVVVRDQATAAFNGCTLTSSAYAAITAGEGAQVEVWDSTITGHSHLFSCADSSISGSSQLTV